MILSYQTRCPIKCDLGGKKKKTFKGPYQQYEMNQKDPL